MDLVEAFERAVEELRGSPEFGDVEFVAHRVRRNGRTFALSATVDRAGGVDLAACERIAGRLNAALEERSEPYTLEVESAGLDRPLVRPDDFIRFADSDVRIRTTLPIDHEYVHRGRLRGMRGNAVVIDGPRGELPIPFEMVKSANVEYDVRADLRRAKQEKRERS